MVFITWALTKQKKKAIFKIIVTMMNVIFQSLCCSIQVPSFSVVDLLMKMEQSMMSTLVILAL